MPVRFRSRTVRKQRGRELFIYSAVLNSYIMSKWEKDKCWLPSCGKELDSRNCQRHHWDFMGKLKDPWCYPEAIHLFCSHFCHDKAHKIAALMIVHLENYPVIYHKDLIESVAFILNEPSENIEFVLKDEFFPAKMAMENKKGECSLIQGRAFRVFNVKKYLAMRDRQMALNLGIPVSYN